MKPRAFTLLEIIITMVLLGILAAAIAPSTKKVVKRRKEAELKHSLLEVRTAIDRFKRAFDDGLIIVEDPKQLGYPKSMEELISGAAMKKESGKIMRFLRKIPTDPMTGEAAWGMRSTYDDPDGGGWGRENLFDIYSLSDGIAMDGTEYSEW